MQLPQAALSMCVCDLVHMHSKGACRRNAISHNVSFMCMMFRQLAVMAHDDAWNATAKCTLCCLLGS